MIKRSSAAADGSHTPRFGYLLRLGLESIGVRYVSTDVLRKAKKNQTTEVRTARGSAKILDRALTHWFYFMLQREYWALWRLLHDLVLVMLADFEVDMQEMERLNSKEAVESGLLDPKLHGAWR